MSSSSFVIPPFHSQGIPLVNPGDSLGVQLVKESACNAGDTGLIPGLGRSTGEGIGYPLQYFWASPCASAGKESACNARDLGSIPGLGRSAAEGIGYPFLHIARISGLFCSLIHLQHQLKISTQGLPWRSSI